MDDEDAAWLASLRPGPRRISGLPSLSRTASSTRRDVCLSASGRGRGGRASRRPDVPGVRPVARGREPPCSQRLVCTGRSLVVGGLVDRPPTLGALRDALFRYKYRAETEWSAVFGRLLVGYLDDHMPWFDDYDVVVGVPAYRRPRSAPARGTRSAGCWPRPTVWPAGAGRSIGAPSSRPRRRHRWPDSASAGAGPVPRVSCATRCRCRTPAGSRAPASWWSTTSSPRAARCGRWRGPCSGPAPSRWPASPWPASRGRASRGRGRVAGASGWR